MPSYRASNWSSNKVGQQYYHQRAGNATFRELKARLRRMQVTLAHDVAQRAAPEMTRLAVQAWAEGRKVYGESRPLGVNGNRLSLVKSGATKRTVRFVANGTIVRCVLGTRYAKYLIGKYGILPNGALPANWSRALDRITSEVIQAQ